MASGCSLNGWKLEDKKIASCPEIIQAQNRLLWLKRNQRQFIFFLSSGLSTLVPLISVARLLGQLQRMPLSQLQILQYTQTVNLLAHQCQHVLKCVPDSNSNLLYFHGAFEMKLTSSST